MENIMENKRIVRSFTKKDFRVQTYRGSGAGGQNRNKLETGVRIIHDESGITVECCEQRTQGQNKKIAFRRLVDRLLEYYFPKVPKVRAPCTTRIRTYHKEDGYVKDHRTGNVYNYESVVNGKGMDQVIEDTMRLQWENK
jgi:protein subunit release factor A